MIKYKKEKKKSKKETKERKLLFSHNRRELLAHTTCAEASACKILTRLNVKYVKQYPIFTGKQTFYADIYIPSLRLVLEIDGGYHYTSEQMRKDRNRSSAIRRRSSIAIYRLSNHDARLSDKIIAKLTRRKRELLSKQTTTRKQTKSASACGKTAKTDVVSTSCLQTHVKKS